MEMNVTYEYLLSQPMFYRFLNAVSDGVFKKKYFLLYDGEKTFHLIKILKRLCYYYEKKAWYNLLPCSGLRNLCQRFYHAPNILSRGTKYCARKRLAMLILKWKGWFQVLISHFWLMISEKSITKCRFLHYGAHMHTKKNCANISDFFSP